MGKTFPHFRVRVHPVRPKSVRAHWMVQPREDMGQASLGTLVMPLAEWLSLRASLPANIEIFEGA